MQRKISDVISFYLENLNIDKIFGVAGGVIEPLLNSIGKEEFNIEAMNFASENQSCFIAQSYGEAKNKFGVVFSIWGAGETNMVNAVSSAYLSNKKLLILVASGNQKNESRSPAQDTNTTNGINSLGIFNNITVYNEKITSKHNFEDKLRQALIKMYLHERPVRLDIPKNILEEEIYFDAKNFSFNLPEKNIPNSKTTQELIDIIKNKKVNLFVGSRCEKIKNTIEKISSCFSHNIFETSTGKGIINPNHENYKGVFGISGVHDDKSLKSEYYNIFIGDSLNEENTNGWSEFLVNNLIYIHDVLDFVNTPLNNEKIIFSDLKELFDSLEKHLKLKNNIQKTIKKEEKYTDLKNNAKISPVELIEKMSNISNNKTVSFFDIGNSFLWGIKYWKGKEHFKNKQNFKIGTGLSTMGWALGSSIGYSLANNEELVFCFIGDGSLLMSSNEILMLKDMNIRIVFIILNDGILGTVFHGQNLSNSLPMCNKIPKINFHEIFNSNGIESYVIKNINEIDKIKNKITETKSPIVIDVHIDEKIEPPLGQRLKNLQ